MSTELASRRLPDWERLLGEYVQSVASEVFSWGFDCFQMSMSAVEAMTGVHPAPHLVGGYSDRKGAAQVLRDRGNGTLLKTMDALFVRCPPGMARRGDLVMTQGAVGICMGAFGLFLTEKSGLTRIPRGEFSHGWRV
jgi:hypothetical protein